MRIPIGSALMFFSCWLTLQTVCAQETVQTTVQGNFPIELIPTSPFNDSSAIRAQQDQMRLKGQILDYGVSIATQCKTSLSDFQTRLTQAIAANSLGAAWQIVAVSEQTVAQAQAINAQVFRFVNHSTDSPAGRAHNTADANLAAAKQTLAEMQAGFFSEARKEGAAQNDKIKAYADLRNSLVKAVDDKTDRVAEFAQFTAVDQTALNISDLVGHFIPGAPPDVLAATVPFESLPADLATRPNNDFLDGLRAVSPTTGLAQAFKYQAELLKLTGVGLTPERMSIWDVSVTALRVAYQDARDKVGDVCYRFYKMSKDLLHYATTPGGIADFGTALTPGVSEARGFYELISGKDAISGGTLGLGSRALVGVGVMLGVGSGPEEVVASIERVLSKEALAGSEHSIEAAKSVAEAEKAQAGTRAALEEANKASPDVVSSIVANDPEDLGDLGKVITDADNPNKVSHVLNNPEHDLKWLVQKYGSEQDAYKAIVQATEQAVTSQNLTGIYKTTVQVGDKTMTVEGKVVDGVARISTAYIP